MGTKRRVRWFAGAACLTPYLIFPALERMSRDLQARSKAAPLQAIGHATPAGEFELQTANC